VNVDELRKWINPVGRDSKSTFEEMAARFAPSETWTSRGFTTVEFDGKWAEGCFYVLTNLGVHFQASARRGPLGGKTQAVYAPWAQVRDVATGMTGVFRDVTFTIASGQKVTFHWPVYTRDISPSPAEVQQQGFIATYQKMSQSPTTPTTAPTGAVTGTTAWGPPTELRRTRIDYNQAFAQCPHNPQCSMCCERWGGFGLNPNEPTEELGQLVQRAARAFVDSAAATPMSILEPGLGSAPEGSGWIVFEYESRLEQNGWGAQPYVEESLGQIRLLPFGTLIAANCAVRWERGDTRADLTFASAPSEDAGGGTPRLSSIVDDKCDHLNSAWWVKEDSPRDVYWESYAGQGGNRLDRPTLLVPGYGLASVLDSIGMHGPASLQPSSSGRSRNPFN